LSLKIDIITLFPDLIRAAVDHSMIKRAQTGALVEIAARDLRDWTHDKRRTVDDSPYGGGAGMVLKPEPLFEAVEAIRTPESRVVLMTPQGKSFDQEKARRYAQLPHLVLICGHYEGFDERIREHLVDEELSIGDYVLTGGELAALVVTDAVTRLIPGVLGNSESADAETFEGDLLEYPQYTRPVSFRGWSVPEVLLSGHHGEVAKWRKGEQERRTQERRPDLWERYQRRAALKPPAKQISRPTARDEE
jgi:tRNA (guanine37-N1)-methyltransferase